MPGACRTALTLCAALITAHAPAWAQDRYHLEFSDDGGVVDVEACFDGTPPSRLDRHGRAHEFTRFVRHEGRELEGAQRRGRLYLGRLPEDACVEWQVDLARAARERDHRFAIEIGEHYLVHGRLFLWRGYRRDLVVDVRPPDGVSLSVPWAPDPGRANRYRPEVTPTGWTSHIAIGDFDVQRIEVPGATLRLAILGDTTAQERRRIREWIADAAGAVTHVHGEFPRAWPQVIVADIGARREAVPWAHVMRGGGVAAEFFVDASRPLGDFLGDWTAVHEFSHMLMPYVSSRDRWLSEGVASYYQNVLRARNGRLTPQQAWQRLHDGFRRGERGTRSGTLAEATAYGRGSTMRVYWSGAAMMLMADLRLRDVTGGRQSLDSVLAALRDCCFARRGAWRARELLSEMDRLSGTTVFSDLYREHVHEEGFPDVFEVYEELGLDLRYNRVSLAPRAPKAGLREQIMGG